MDVLEKYSAALAAYKAANYETALQILGEVKNFVPQWTKAHLLEGYIRREQKFYVEEICVLENLLPKIDLSVPSEKNLAAVACSLLGSAYRNLGDAENAVKFFLQSARFETSMKAACTEISNAIFAANDSEKFSAADFRKMYAEYQSHISEIIPLPKKLYRHEKIRVGYISADLHEHPVTTFLLPLIIYHDKNNFEIYCYSAGGKADFVTKKIILHVNFWRDISSMTDEDAANLIRADEIDILFDLSGHTAENRLLTLAYRPAPVQISGIGYMNSTGLDCVDYFLSDRICAANGLAMQNFFTEKIICLPYSHFCYAPLKSMPAPSDAPCKSKNFITFGCFNNFSKVTDLMLTAWREILNAVPQSRLILKHKIFDTDEGKSFVRERLKSLGFKLSRVELRNYSTNYLHEYAEIDIALDTFPYTGGITTCEALYMGVPVVSLYGDRHGTRFGLSFLKNVGIDELAAENLSDYIKKAVALANDWELLSVLHKNLRAMMQKSPLMNFREYVKDVESAYFEVYHAKQNSQLPNT